MLSETHETISFVEEGLEAALQRRKRQNYTRKLGGDAEAHLIAVACGEPPKDYKR